MDISAQECMSTNVESELMEMRNIDTSLPSRHGQSDFTPLTSGMDVKRKSASATSTGPSLSRLRLLA